MSKIELSRIHISERQRKVLTPDDIKGMAKSLSRYGQLQPILLNKTEDGQFELVAGFTRIQGAMMLGWSEIEYTTREDLGEILAKEIELEENVRRKQLEWWERANAIAEIDTLRKASDPEWSNRKTAELVGVSVGTVSQSVQLNEEITENPEILKEKTLVSALKKLDVKKKILKRKEDIARKRKGKGPAIAAQIFTGDALELIRKEPDESFDAVVTNLPFGVDLELKGGNKPYEDEEEYIIQLVQGVVEESFRILKDDSWFVAWFDIRKITYSNHQLAVWKALSADGLVPDEFRQLLFDSMGLTFWLEQAGFSYVTLVPGIWAKPNKTQGIIGDPRKGFIAAYEAMIFASKGDAVLLKQGRNNLWVYDTPPASERVHPLQMPTELCAEVVSLVSLGGGRILDPFAGSGSIGLGALTRQCEFVGYELDPAKAENGNLRLQEHVYASTPRASADEGEGDSG